MLILSYLCIVLKQKMKDYRIIYNNICTGLSKYIKENHMSTMILGISGGIDSTICAVICNEVSKRTGIFNSSVYEFELVD